MTTKAEMVAILKLENPTLQSGNEEDGYSNLNAADYKTTIERWADNLLAKEAEAAQDVATATAKAALLVKLGITADEAVLLLS
jgi:uncharacterized protein YfdQ (DUF2303 family)